jgi:hypothetical protein
MLIHWEALNNLWHRGGIQPSSQSIGKNHMSRVLAFGPAMLQWRLHQWRIHAVMFYTISIKEVRTRVCAAVRSDTLQHGS